jgi:hypothetical protein
MSLCRVLRPLAVCLPLAQVLFGCVPYRPAPADPAQLAAALHQRQGGHLDLAGATALAFQQNPTLQALAERARAAGVAAVPSDTQTEYRTQGEMLALMVDPVSLLNLGPRGAANTLLQAEAVAASHELAVARWQVATRIAEAFAVDAALAALPPDPEQLDGAPFVAAGLAAQRAAAAVVAATSRLEAEGQRRATARATNLAQLRELLGLAGTAELRLQHGPWPPPEQGDLDSALLRRPDLALATARFAVADANFRRAVAAQYPSLMFGPEVPLRGDPLQLMAILRLPLFASDGARAAAAQREAARADLAAAWLAASRAAAVAELEQAGTRAAAAAASAAWTASQRNLAASRVAVDVEVDAFGALADSYAMAVRDWAEVREPMVAAARAEVQVRFARGLPALEATP